MSYLLGMMGPINVQDFREYLHPGQWHDDLPKGLGGSPVNLLSRELLRRGQNLVVMSLDPAVRDEVILEGDRLRICIGPFRPKRARDFFSAERAYLRHTIARERPDVIHAQWTYEFALAAQASGLPHVITAHDAPINVLRHNPIPYRIARTLMAYRVTTRARRVVSVAPHVAEHLKRYMFYRGESQIIPNGMPAHLFERPVRVACSDQPLTFASILVGWGGYKNGRIAIEAFGIVRKQLPDARLIMFGAGHGCGEAAENWAREQGLADGIEFAGQTPYAQVLERLGKEVDVLVHPALEEAQPMVLIEAMAQGVPVIGGVSSGGVPWTLDYGKGGLLVDVTSPHEVAGAMLTLAKAEAREDWGRRGKCLAEQRFHIRAIADAYQPIYESLREKR